MHASPHLSFSEPEKDNQNQKPSKEKCIDEFDKENPALIKNNASYDLLNELLGKANNVNEDCNFNDIEISLDEGKPELRPVFINSTVKDVEDIDISKEDEDLFKSSDSFNESGSQVDYIKKLLNHCNKNYQYDDSSNIEFAAKESIKKTQQAYEDIIHKRKEREIKVTQQITSSKIEGKTEIRELISEPNIHPLNLDEQLGFSSDSESKQDKEEIKEDKNFIVDEVLSDTSDDEFPLNKLEKLKINERESNKKYEKPSISIPDNEEYYNEIKDNSQLKQSERNLQSTQGDHKETDELTEDTMCKLVQFLDCDDSDQNIEINKDKTSNHKQK